MLDTDLLLLAVGQVATSELAMDRDVGAFEDNDMAMGEPYSSATLPKLVPVPTTLMPNFELALGRVYKLRYCMDILINDLCEKVNLSRAPQRSIDSFGRTEKGKPCILLGF